MIVLYEDRTSLTAVQFYANARLESANFFHLPLRTLQLSGLLHKFCRVPNPSSVSIQCL
jgi:hypothetical protein